MQEKYDVVVVGSGLGGLLAGASLAHSGYKTLVVETLSRIGGKCSTEEYEGFKLTTGAPSLHYHGTEIEEVFNEVGAEFEFATPSRLCYRIAGTDYEMPAKGALGMWLDVVNKLEEDRVKLTGGLVRAVAKEKILAAWKRGAQEPQKEKERTFKEWLLQYTDNELTHSLFDVISTMWGGHIHEVPASDMFGFMVAAKGFRDVVIAPRGNIGNMEKLADVVKVNGDVWLNCRATQILVTGKEAKAVVVQKDGGEVEVASQVVISNIRPKATVELAGEGNFDQEYLRTVRRLRPNSCFVCFIASDRPLWPEDGSSGVLQVAGTRRLNAFIPYTNLSPEYAPPGQCLAFALGFPQSMFAHMDEEVEKEQMLLDIKEHFPLFEKHGRVLKWLFRHCDDELPYLGTASGEGIPFCETPVRNLYCVGDAIMTTFGLGGSPCAAASAKVAAGIVKKRYKPGQA